VLGEAYLAESLLGAGVEHGRLAKQPHGLILVLAVGQHAPNASANSGSAAVAAGTRTLKDEVSWISKLRLDFGLKQIVNMIKSIYLYTLVLSCCNWSFTRHQSAIKKGFTSHMAGVRDF